MEGQEACIFGGYEFKFLKSVMQSNSIDRMHLKSKEQSSYNNYDI